MGAGEGRRLIVTSQGTFVRQIDSPVSPRALRTVAGPVAGLTAVEACVGVLPRLSAVGELDADRGAEEGALVIL